MSFDPMGAPNSFAPPLVAGSRPVSIFIVVDLPQPFEPRKPKISPRPMRMLTWSTAVKSPNRRVSPSASIAGTVSSLDGRGRITTSWCCERSASGSRAMKAASRFFSPVFCRICGVVPVAIILPLSMATSQSKRSASSM